MIRRPGRPTKEATIEMDTEIESQRTVDGLLGRIHQQDCIDGMKQIDDQQIDLVFADPPFNIGYKYDVYDDRREAAHYLDWSCDWISQVHRVLKADGAFWLAIGDEYAAELKVTAQEIGFHCRSWVVWYYTFGVHCTHKFTRSHAHLFHFVKNPGAFTFNNGAVRVPSARQLVYGDARANPAGRMPDDTWILRPQDLVDGFTPSEDVWYFPRVAGTFKERAGFHGCQMPEQLLGRVIRCSSNEGDVVLDPFSGSATTVTVAKKLGRQWMAFELSDEYAKLGADRLAAAAVGDPLDGAEDPRISAPPTRSRDKKKSTVVTTHSDTTTSGFRQGRFDFDGLVGQEDLLTRAFAQSSEGFSVDRVLADPVLSENFQTACDRFAIPGTAAERGRRLFAMRHNGILKAAGIDTSQRTEFPWRQQRRYLFASEIAWRQLSDQYPNHSLDELLCDPRLANQFDQLAARFAPGFRPLEYRWAALCLRKKTAAALRQASQQTAQGLGIQQFPSAVVVDARTADWEQLPASAGVYAIRSGEEDYIYAGETDDLRQRLRQHFASEQLLQEWRCAATELRISYAAVETVDDYPLARQCLLVQWHHPVWNMLG